MHYLNNAGAGIVADETLHAVVQHFSLEQKVGPYAAARQVADEMAECYASAAAILGAPTEAISLHDSASRAWNMALYGCGLERGDRIVTLSSEFGTNLVTLYHYARQVGAAVKVVPCDPRGDFDLTEFERYVADGAKLVAVSHAAAHGSIVNPVEKIGGIAARYGATYLVDGCQAVGQIPVNVSTLHCDVYTGSGRKWLRGPRGTAFLYVRQGSDVHTPQVDLASADLAIQDGVVTGVDVRTDGRQFELWERSVASFMGLGVALSQYRNVDQQNVSEALAAQATRLRAAVLSNPLMRLIGHVDARTGIVGFYLSDPDREAELQAAFDQAGLVISTMADWDCPLHFPTNGATRIFRLSPHFQTSAETIELAGHVLEQFG